MINISPENDGIDHINIYSKGKTILGQFLSNFAFSPFNISPDGTFNSVEACWYWLGNQRDEMRSLHGFQAKKLGKGFERIILVNEDIFQDKIRQACWIKIHNNSKMLNEFINSSLPFTHYYNYGGKVVNTNLVWILEMWELFRTTLQNSIITTLTYTGVGSRKTPQNILSLMYNIAIKMSNLKYTLRSGGAQGADKAFELGASVTDIFYAKDCTPEAMAIAEAFHPKWYRCADFAKKLHGRNAFQVLGKDLKTPSNLLICWTADGCKTHAQRTVITGGTGTAISIADNAQIPISNLANPEDLDTWQKWLYS